MANIFDQFDAREEQRTSNVFDQFDPQPKKAEPTESGGFFGSFGTALKERAETAAPSAKIFTNLGDQKQATDELLNIKDKHAQAYKQTEFSEIGDAFKAGNFGQALGQTIDKFKEVAGSSLGSMAPAMVAGAGAALAAPVALPAAAVGTAAFGVVALGSYIADNIGRQKEELNKEGDKYGDVNRLSATAAGAAQTALDVFGFKFFKPLGALVGIEGKATAQQAAMEIVEAATKPNAYARAVASGAAKGIAFEVPQEVTQQVLERWQAGLALDPFTDPEAAKEYMEAAGGAMLLGGPMGSYSSAMQTKQARATPEGEELLKGNRTPTVEQGTLLADIDKGLTDDTRLVKPTSGESAGVAGEPDSGVSAGRTTGADTGRVVPARPDAESLDVGEGQRPSALSENARQNYNDLRAEMVELMSITRPTPADMNRMKMVQGDLTQLVEDNASAITAATGNRELTEFHGRKNKSPPLLTNPLFEGDQVFADIELANEAIGQPRAMQGDMFGTTKGARMREEGAAALAGKDPAKTLNELQLQRQRVEQRLATGKYDANWAMTKAPELGISRGEAAQNAPAIAERYAQKELADIDQAIANLQRQPRAMQGDMFSEQKKPEGEFVPGESLEDVFDARKAPQESQIGMRAKQKSAEIEARTKGKVAPAGASMSSQENLDILTAEEGRVAKNLADVKTVLANLTPESAKRVDLKTELTKKQALQEQVDMLTRQYEQVSGARRDLEAKIAEFGSTESVTPKVAQPKEQQPKKKAAAPEITDMFAKEKQTAKEDDAAAKIESAIKAREIFKKREVEPDEEFGVYKDENLTKEAPKVDTATDTGDQKGAPVRAPTAENELDHVAATTEGVFIKDLFESVKAQTESPQEIARHGEALNSAAKQILEFDIATKGQRTSEGIQRMFAYLADRVGSVDALRNMLNTLRNATPKEQSSIFASNELPDLTTRRGMDVFRKQIESFISQLAEPKEGGVRFGAFGIYRGKPYKDVLKTTKQTLVQPEAMTSGQPRQAFLREEEVVNVIHDFKLRAGQLALKQAVEAGAKLSPAQMAATTYLNNKYRNSFGETLNHVAYDLANYELDQDNFGRGYVFPNEGGKAAINFKSWIEANTDPSTVTILNDLIADHKVTAQANAAAQDAAVKYREKRDEWVTKATSPVMGRRATKRTKISDIKEVKVDRDIDYTQNLPKIKMLVGGEINPTLLGLLKKGKTNEVLQILAEADNGKGYYSALAQRLLDAGITAKTKLIDADKIESLSNNPSVRDSLDKRLGVVADIVRAQIPVAIQSDILLGLKSKKMRDLSSTLSTLKASFGNYNLSDAQVEAFDSTIKLFESEFSWYGKYDPNSDSIVLRQGASRLTNHLFMHEALHAATLHLLDNNAKLTGIQRQGYDRLVELYNYAKSTLSAEETKLGHRIYGLQDIHEFISEALTNPIFQAQLRRLQYKASTLSLWNTFTNALRKLFNVKEGRESNVMVETMFATDALIAGPITLDGLTNTTGPKAMSGAKAPKPKVMRPGLPNQPSTVQRWLNTRTWTDAKREFNSLSANVRPTALGALTLRQIADLVGGRITQVDNFVRVSEEFLSRKNYVLNESADIAKKWERLQSKDPVMSRQLGEVMAMATIKEVDPDKATTNQRNANQDLMQNWRALSPTAQGIYRDVRNFYDRRHSEYKSLMNRRIIQMRKLGVSEATITEIRNEFEKSKLKGPYFPLMRFGRFWYQIGKGTNREFYMFDSQAARDRHIEERIKQDPYLADTIGDKVGNDFKTQMDFHARESKFLKDTFAAIDSSSANNKQDLKDTIYQTYLANQPDRSMRNQFIHRQNIAGYSEDALRGFASSSFNMAYQLARFQYSPEMFSQLEAARMQIKDRQDASTGYDPKLTRENDELRDYVKEVDQRLQLMMNPPDVGRLPQLLSNAGFIWYLTAPASAIVNVLGGMMVGLPTLIGQQVKSNPKMSYTTATLNSLSQMKQVAGEIMRTGFKLDKSEKLIDTELDFPSLDRSNKLTPIERAAYNRFVADGLIDITATYDQAGLAEQPTTSYTGAGHRTMVILSKLFHNAERFNREVMAMSAFRTALDKYKGQNLSDRAAFAKAIAEAKDVTNRSMFDYSATNKPRYFQHPVARIVTQFKQFPQQMTYFLCQSLYNSIKGESPAVKREARARFVGTMGMAAIFSGATGIWGFSTMASIANAVFNGLGDEEEEPFDFELEFVNWANETFGANIGTLLTRGVGNAAGIDLASRVKLDEMWFRDGRKNQDATASWKDKIVELLGPSIGLTVNVTDAMDLYSKGYGDRAIEKVLPAFAKNPMVAARYANEGVRNMSHDPLIENVGAFDLLMQSLGIRSAELAERQFYNITKKGQEQAIHKQRQNLLNLYGLTFMSGDIDRNVETFEAMMKFSTKHPTLAIDADVLISSITERLNKAVQTDHGLYIDPKLRQLLNEGYKDSISNRPNVFDMFD
jgi:hypothetical protein